MERVSVKEFKENLRDLIVKYGYNSIKVRDYQNETIQKSNYTTVFRVSDVVVEELKAQKQFRL